MNLTGIATSIGQNGSGQANQSPQTPILANMQRQPLGQIWPERVSSTPRQPQPLPPPSLGPPIRSPPLNANPTERPANQNMESIQYTQPPSHDQSLNAGIIQQLQAHTQFLQRFENSMVQFIQQATTAQTSSQATTTPSTSQAATAPNAPAAAMARGSQPETERNDNRTARRAAEMVVAPSRSRNNENQDTANGGSSSESSTESSSDTETTSSSSSRRHHSRRRSPRNSRHRRHRHAFKKPITPNLWGFTFSGEEASSDKKDVSAPEFLRAVELFRKSESYSKQDTLSFMSTLLRGTAKRWWMNQSDRVTSYRQFQKVFREQWLDDDFETNAFMDVVAYRQTNESVKQYLVNFETKVSYCLPRPSDRQLVSILLRNLSEEYRKDVDLKEPKTISDIRKICKKIDRNQEKRSKPPRSDKYHERERPYKYSSEKTRDRHAFAVECLGADYETDDDESKLSPFEVCLVNKISDGETGSEAHQQTKEFRCFNCKQLGHAWRQCKSPIEEPFCMHCGLEGVKITNCTRKACQDFYKERLRKRAEKLRHK